ncbi:hypothetical protein L1887_48248 [Cichorium endivia]|nr:hypothetical protein L1887_48248 [Cichorium endivia]
MRRTRQDDAVVPWRGAYACDSAATEPHGHLTSKTKARRRSLGSYFPAHNASPDEIHLVSLRHSFIDSRLMQRCNEVAESLTASLAQTSDLAGRSERLNRRCIFHPEVESGRAVSAFSAEFQNADPK